MKIQIVEDDVVFPVFISRMIEKHTHHKVIGQFSSAEEYIEFLDKSQGDKEATPNLLLLDLGLPGINGWGVLDYIVSNNLKIDVIIITLSKDAIDFEKSKQYSIVKGFYNKSNLPTNLFSLINVLE